MCVRIQYIYNKGGYRRDSTLDAVFFLQNVFCTVAGSLFGIGGWRKLYIFLTHPSREPVFDFAEHQFYTLHSDNLLMHK